MKDIIYDLITFIKSLTIIDVLFLISIIVLIIMLVSLIYVMKLNKDEVEEIDEVIEEIPNEENIKEEDSKEVVEDSELDLLEISKQIDEKKILPVSLNDYEKEQEEKAIISYDELLASKKDYNDVIEYTKEEDLNGLTVKEVDIKSLTLPIELPKIKDSNYEEEKKIEVKKEPTSILMSYEKEEAFLETLKKMQSLLN